MTCQAPYINSAGCVVTPACAGNAAIPAQTLNQPILQWNAGADSVALVAGNASAVFQMPTGNVGVILGFKTTRLFPTVPTLITHGLYFFSVTGAGYAQVVENGQTLGAAFPYAATDTFEIRRTSSVVTYWQNGTLLRTSSQPSYAPLIVNTCLYASGDQAPSLGGGSLAASFSCTPFASNAQYIALADTSTGSNIVWRSWGFTNTPYQYYALPSQTIGLTGSPDPGASDFGGYVVPSGGGDFANPFDWQLPILYVRITGAAPNTITLTVTDSLGNTSTTSQSFSSLGA